MTKTTLTTGEAAMLRAFIEEGRDCNCAESAEALIADNMTWMDPWDLEQDLGISLQEVGGLMTALSNKGLISDSGEPLPERTLSAWTATEEGIRVGWDL